MANNPMFNEAAFERAKKRQQTAVPPNEMYEGEQPLRRISTNTMTLQGTINKTFFLLFLCVAGGVYGWMHPVLFTSALPIALAIVALVIGVMTSFMPVISPFTAPLYALLEGFLLGGVSAAYNQMYNGIVSQAVMLTLLVFAIMLFVYKTGIIRVTQQLKTGIVSATAAIAIFYLVSFIGSFFGMNISYLTSSSPLSIGISVVICIVAALNFLLDFEFINVMCQRGDSPRFMEWYAGFGLMLTLIWLYIEILKLLAKSRRR